MALEGLIPCRLLGPFPSDALAVVSRGLAAWALELRLGLLVKVCISS